MNVQKKCSYINHQDAIFSGIKILYFPVFWCHWGKKDTKKTKVTGMIERDTNIIFLEMLKNIEHGSNY